MYDVALSVSACLRAGTRTDVAWLVPNEHLTPTHFTESLAITKGGGRIGKVANGIFDGQLLDIAERALSKGRVLDLMVGPLEATLSSLPVGTKAKFAIAPVTQFPAELWPLLVGRQSVAIDVNFNEGVIEKIDVYSESDLHNASSEIQEYFLTGESKIIQLENRIITVYRPVPKLVIAGTGAMANAIQKNAELLGWQVSVDPRPENVMGLVANHCARLSCIAREPRAPIYPALLPKAAPRQVLEFSTSCPMMTIESIGERLATRPITFSGRGSTETCHPSSSAFF